MKKGEAMHSHAIRRLCFALLMMVACQAATAESADSAAHSINTLADRYYEWALRRTPELAYFSGVESDRHDTLFDNSPAARQRAMREEDALCDAISSIDSALVAGKTEWITHAFLQQELAAAIDKRVCRNDLWNIIV